MSYGAAEFAAAEELSRHHGFWWSPDGRQLLVARVDTRDVTSCWLGDPTYNEQEPVRQRYPRAGTANAVVGLVLAGLDGAVIAVAGAPDERLPYLMAARWDTGRAPTLALLARDQHRAEVRTVNPVTGQTLLVHADTDPAWLQLMPGTPRWLPDDRLLRCAVSEDTYRLFVDDQPCTPAGLQVLGVVSAGERTVFRATTEPTERHLYALDHATGAIEQLTSEPGVHDGVAAGNLLAITSETLDSDGATVRVYDRRAPAGHDGSLARQQSFAPQVTLLRAGERELRTAVILPRDDRRPPGPLPVLMAPYGGPSQQVLKARRLFNEPQWLADQGFAVVVADGRGSPGRGPGWERAFYLDVATPALDDQVAALEHVMDRYPGELDAGAGRHPGLVVRGIPVGIGRAAPAGRVRRGGRRRAGRRLAVLRHRGDRALARPPRRASRRVPADFAAAAGRGPEPAAAAHPRPGRRQRPPAALAAAGRRAAGGVAPAPAAHAARGDAHGLAAADDRGGAPRPGRLLPPLARPGSLIPVRPPGWAASGQEQRCLIPIRPSGKGGS